MTKDILSELIIKKEESGFSVAATLNDLFLTMMRLWKKLEISVGNTSFTNPAVFDRQI